MRYTGLSQELQREWADWVALNIQRGCSVETLISNMTAGGVFDVESAMQQIIRQGHPQTRHLSVVRAAKDAESSAASHGATAPQHATPPVLSHAAAATQAQTDVQKLPFAEIRPHLFSTHMLPLPERIVRTMMRLQKPVIATLDNVLSHEECDALVAMARPRLNASRVIDRDTGEHRPDAARDSTGADLSPTDSPLIQLLDGRLSAIMGRPMNHGEHLQVLRYGVGGQYVPHYDYHDPESASMQELLKPERGGNRAATLILYLNDVMAGGETYFPHLDLRIVPRKGAALYFEYTNTFGQVDARTLHGGLPVHAGEKWIATKWMHLQPIAM